MSEETIPCPKCDSPYSYPDGELMICPECFHEWSPSATEEAAKYLDINGVELQTGDNVTLARDLKMGKEILKSGTKVKGIRLLDDPVDGHDISCKIPGHGSVYLKCSVVKKAT